MQCIALQALQWLQALHVQFLWQQPAASDCNQDQALLCRSNTLIMLVIAVCNGQTGLETLKQLYNEWRIV